MKQLDRVTAFSDERRRIAEELTFQRSEWRAAKGFRGGLRGCLSDFLVGCSGWTADVGVPWMRSVACISEAWAEACMSGCESSFSVGFEGPLEEITSGAPSESESESVASKFEFCSRLRDGLVVELEVRV